MNTADINIVLAMVVILAAIAAFAIRESAEALEAISRWAAARAWGIRCAAVELERRRALEEAVHE